MIAEELQAAGVVGRTRRTAPRSSGIVSSHEQIRRCPVNSAIALTITCSQNSSSSRAPKLA
jgi:hypothetical protein